VDSSSIDIFVIAQRSDEDPVYGPSFFWT